MSTDPPTGFSSGSERSQAARDAGGIPHDDPSIVDTRSMHGVGGVGSGDTYGQPSPRPHLSPSPLRPLPLTIPFPGHCAGFSGSSESSHVHPARLGHHHDVQGGGSAAAAGAASFAGQKKCSCEQNGVCTCKGACDCANCTGKHTEAQLAGKSGQPEHPRAAVTGI